MSGIDTLFRSLRHPNYRLFFVGQAASLVGMWLQLTAQSWLIYRLTDSAAAVGLMTFAMQGPGLFLGPIAGALADRHEKRRILVIAQALAMIPALALGLLALAGVVRPWHIIALAFASGLARSFEIPTRQAFIHELVEPRDLANAIALNSALFNGARLVGPPVAGVLILLVGEAWCFLANAASYTAIVAALLALRLPQHDPKSRQGTSIFTEIREGLSYVRQRPGILSLLGIVAVGACAGMPYSVLLPSFANRMLGGGPLTYSYLLVAVAIGAVAGALTLASRSVVSGLERWAVGAGVSFGFWLMAVSTTRSVLLAIVCLIPMGFSFMIQMATTNTLLQTLAPDHLRGRIMSLHTWAFLGLFPVSSLLTGALADRYGEAAVLATGGLLVATSTVFLGRFTLRHVPAALASARSRTPLSSMETEGTSAAVRESQS